MNINMKIMKINTLYHKYKNNLVDFELPDDEEFIRSCAKRYIINQIKNRNSIKKYRKTAKGKATYMLASRKYYRKKQAEKLAKDEAKIVVKNRLKLNYLKK
jgi:hypothetical protein